MSDRVDKFVAYLNESQLTVVPPTLVVWRDGECLEPVEVALPPHYRHILSRKERLDLEARCLRELVKQAGATAVLYVCQMKETEKDDPTRAKTPVIMAIYEDEHGLIFRSYPIRREAGDVITLETFTEDYDPQGPLIGLLPKHE